MPASWQVLTPTDVSDFLQLWMSPEGELRKLALSQGEGGRGKAKGSKARVGASSNIQSLGVKKSHLSDIWRVCEFNGRWSWTNFEHTEGKGNATLSTTYDVMRVKVCSFGVIGAWGHTSTSASTHVCMQVRNYNVANGITKAVTASLETQDILEAKHRTYRKMLGEVRGLVQLVERELSPSHSSPDELEGADNLKSATDEFVSKNVLAAVILADIEISRCILKASLCKHSTSTLVYTAADPLCTPARALCIRTPEDCTHDQPICIPIGAVVYTHPKGIPNCTLAPQFSHLCRRNGFHRAETLNLKFDELRQCFDGVHDLPNTGKRRYDGAQINETCTHRCSSKLRLVDCRQVWRMWMTVSDRPTDLRGLTTHRLPSPPSCVQTMACSASLEP